MYRLDEHGTNKMTRKGVLPNISLGGVPRRRMLSAWTNLKLRRSRCPQIHPPRLRLQKLRSFRIRIGLSTISGIIDCPLLLFDSSRLPLLAGFRSSRLQMLPCSAHSAFGTGSAWRIGKDAGGRESCVCLALSTVLSVADVRSFFSNLSRYSAAPYENRWMNWSRNHID